VVIYRFLSRVFAYPDLELISLFDKAELAEFLANWRKLGIDAEADADRVTTWLTQYPDYGTALLELCKEYTRLFITAYPKAVAPPYSSIYLDKDRLIWGESTTDAALFYKLAGLSLNEDFHDVPDHIAAELEFVAYVITEQLRNNELGLPLPGRFISIEKRFLNEHLFKWVPLFFSKVAACSTLTFYQVMANLALRLIERDLEYLAET